MLPLIALISGIIFSLGLGISGMVRPTKVLAFLNLFGDWEPTLLIVLGSGVAFYFVWHHSIKDQVTGLPPIAGMIDMRLLVGGIVFGIGWGLIGFCPGPAITAAITLNPKVLAFVGAMAGGLIVARQVNP